MRGPGNVDFIFINAFRETRFITSFCSRSLYVKVFVSLRFFLGREVSSFSLKRETLTAKMCSAVGVQRGWTCWPNSMKRRKHGLQLRGKFTYIHAFLDAYTTVHTALEIVPPPSSH